MKNFLYMRRVSILLITVALIAGMVGCEQAPSPFGYPPYPITHIACGEHHTVGVKIDGIAVAVGSNRYFQCEVDGWRGIIGVDAGSSHTVGLKADGTVVARGSNYDRQCNVDDWMDIIQVAAGSSHTVGLKSNGSSAMSAAGRASPRSPQATVTRWGLSPTAPRSQRD